MSSERHPTYCIDEPVAPHIDVDDGSCCCLGDCCNEGNSCICPDCSGSCGDVHPHSEPQS